MKLPSPKKYIRTKDGVDFIPSSIYLSVVDMKLRLEMGRRSCCPGFWGRCGHYHGESPASGYDGDAGLSADGGEDQEADQSGAGDCGHPDDHVRVQDEAVQGSDGGSDGEFSGADTGV